MTRLDGLWWRANHEQDDDESFRTDGMSLADAAQEDLEYQLDRDCQHLPLPLPSAMRPAVLVEMFGRDPQDPERGVAA